MRSFEIMEMSSGNRELMLKLNSTMVNVISLVDFIFLLSKWTQFETLGNPVSLVPLAVTPRQVDEV